MSVPAGHDFVDAVFFHVHDFEVPTGAVERFGLFRNAPEVRDDEPADGVIVAEIFLGQVGDIQKFFHLVDRQQAIE